MGEYIDKGIKALQGVSNLCIRLNTSKCHVANFTQPEATKSYHIWDNSWGT